MASKSRDGLFLVVSFSHTLYVKTKWSICQYYGMSEWLISNRLLPGAKAEARRSRHIMPPFFCLFFDSQTPLHYTLQTCAVTFILNNQQPGPVSPPLKDVRGQNVWNYLLPATVAGRSSMCMHMAASSVPSAPPPFSAIARTGFSTWRLPAFPLSWVTSS